ncbi:hypothetical protein BKA70DRAFT_1100720, partial [Coprinopsis sp. MPI-PUGE-AT-0042]
MYAHLDLPSQDAKETIIRQWQTELDPVKMERKTCAVCGKLVLESESTMANPSLIDLELLQNKDLPTHVLPRSYNFAAYKKALLHPHGLTELDVAAPFRACSVCFRDLSNDRMPKFALCNWLYYGREALPSAVLNAFLESTQIERSLISRARTNTICWRFEPPGVDIAEGSNNRGKYYKSAKGMRGNVIFSPLDSMKINSVLPPLPEMIRDTMCVLFTSVNETPTPEKVVKMQLQPVLARKTRVKTLIEFLIQWNPHYRPVAGFRGLSTEALNVLFGGADDEGFPQSIEISHLENNQAMEQANAGLKEPSAYDETVHAGSLLMENVGFTLSDWTPMAYRAMKMRAVEHCLANRVFLRVNRGSSLIPDFNNPYILSWVCPHIDPWGIGGFHHPGRKRAISMEEQLKHMMLMDDPVISDDIEFCLIFYNVIRKKTVSTTLHFTAPAQRYEHIVADILSVDKDALNVLSNKFKNDPKYHAQTASEKKILHTMQNIGLVARNIPGSAAQKISMRNEIRGMIVNRGAPSLFITFCPADKQNGLVQVFARTGYQLEDLLNGTSMTQHEREVLASTNPTACALFFHTMVQAFIRIVLKHGQGVGLFGL